MPRPRLRAWPESLILDEPTAALDVSVQAAILKLLHRLRRDLGLSYLLISHDIIVLRNGQVVEAGRTADILASPQSEYGRTLLAAVPRLKT